MRTRQNAASQLTSDRWLENRVVEHSSRAQPSVLGRHELRVQLPVSQRDLEHWVRAEIRALCPYTVPDASDLIKLDAMENPYGLPPGLVGEWLECLRDVRLNRYPDPSARKLKARLRETLGLPEGDGLILGNGSDELIQIIALVMATAERVLLSPGPSFTMYRIIATLTGMRFVEVPLLPHAFALDMQAMRKAIEQHRPAVIFLAYPNNPTGNLWQRDEVEEIIQRAPGLVVMDEAYAPFASDSLIDRLGEHRNLLVMRTFSKLGLAGLRLGLLAGPSELLQELDKARLPYNVNVLSQVSAEFALRHKAVFDEQAKRIRADREMLFRALNALEGIEAFPSEANFILFRTSSGRADEIYAALMQQGVLIKNLSSQPRLDNCLRVTVGKPAENEHFLKALGHAMKAGDNPAPIGA